MLPLNLTDHARTVASLLRSLIDRGAVQPDDGSVIDRRDVPRRIYMQDGYLTFPEFPAFPATLCLIRDISSAGAQLELSDPIPDDVFSSRIRLYIVPRQHERECRVSWRNGEFVGLRFSGPRLPPSRDYRHPLQRGAGELPPALADPVLDV